MKTGAHGWPLVPSKAFPGESTISCPKCNSTDITLTGRRVGIGTGPGGRLRAGDGVWHDIARCNACRHEQVD